MVETTHPGNVGAAARAMKNMGLENLSLVNPQCKIGETAFARSSGAHSVLDNHQQFETLKQAVAESHLVFGASARIRSLTMPIVTPKQAMHELFDKSEETRVAIVFGREHSGLTNEEMDSCHYALNIPTNEQFSSLNVASAVQVVAYELFQQVNDENGIAKIANKQTEPMALTGDVDKLIEHLEKTLIKTEFLDPLNPKLLMKRLTQLSMRQHLSVIEVNILRGILTSVDKKVG